MKSRNGGDTRGERRETRRGKPTRPGLHRGLPGDSIELPQPRTQASKKPLVAQTETQQRYLNVIALFDLIFCRGPMGTGKTYVAAAAAAEAFSRGEIKQIIITRPAVPAEEEYGFLPGDLLEKTMPWAAPVLKVLEERLGAGHVEYLLKSGAIEIAPLGMLRGHTFNDAWVLFDEAQNATAGQMKLFLTRIGKGAKVIVDGDPDEQLDIPAGSSGFDDAWDRMQGHPQVGFITFDVDDIVRSGLSRDILLRYRKGVSVGQAELGRFLEHRPN